MTLQSPFLRELQWRGFIHQSTDLPGLDAHLCSGNRKAYIGFDPTSDSLTIGNLIPIMILGHFQRAGHTPIVLAGGGTGLIGDPSGKSAERELRTRDQVAANVQAQSRIFSRVLEFSEKSPNRAVIVNNLDWLEKLSYLDALRDIGKHFSVNMMIQKDSIRERLNNRDQGISYTEFSYMLLQAYDFAHLHRAMGVTLQMGASDQWGNIVAGTDLIWSLLRTAHTGDWEAHQADLRQRNETAPFGLTTPLLTKADGGKYGKTESGAVWLTADRTSPFALYQFCLNSADADIEVLLKKLTFLPQPMIEGLMAEHAANPGARAPHRALARSLTAMLHGEDKRDQAEAAAGALFSGDVAGLPLDTLTEIFASAPATTHLRIKLDGDGLPLLDLLVESGLCKSKSEARQALTDGSISVNGKKATPTEKLTPAHLLHNRLLALRRGKKNWHLTRWE